MPWQEPGETQKLTSSALVANILCTRHNSSLSPLDALAGNAFDALAASASYAASQRHGGKIMYQLVSGHGLELWMYKLMAGTYFGGIAAVKRGRLRDLSNFPEMQVADHLTYGSLAGLGGMYVTQSAGLITENEIGIAPLIDVTSKQCAGVQVQFGTLRFETTVVHPNLPTEKHEVMKQRLRPHVIDYCGPARDARVVLTWPKTKGEFRRLGLEIRPKH